MRSLRVLMGLLVCALLAAATVAPSRAADAPAVVVGRVYQVEGELLRYVPEEEDWVAVVRDAPFGVEDAFSSGDQGMAELLVPNGTRIRIGNVTQIQFIALGADLTEMDVASGVARFYNKSSDTVVKVTSPFGYVLARPGTVFDFYVGENSVEVVGLRGEVSFVHSASAARFDVAAGSPSILADERRISYGDGTVDPAWDRWNGVRENFWAAKTRAGGRSAQYLPAGLRDESYALEENGRWESVPYEGADRWFWRPTAVAVGWSPFTVGRWTDWYGDQTWIPAEPFGYVTHHYGNWVYLRNHWYWAPPVARVRAGLPLLSVSFNWYPGRVSWIHTAGYVGWVPLSPRETYYSYRNWGGAHTVVVNKVTINQINVNVSNYAYVNHAVVVKQDDFYRVNDYRKVRLTDTNRPQAITNYRAAPVVNNTVINNYTTLKQRYNYTNVTVKEKPHNTVVKRIQQNDTTIRQGKREDAAVLQQRVKSIKQGQVDREARVEAPKVTNYIVPANEVNRAKAERELPQRQVKSRGGVAPAVRPAVAGKPEQQPDQPAQPGEVPERVAPVQRAQPEKPAAKSERPAPPKGKAQEKPARPTEEEAQKFKATGPDDRGMEGTKGKPQEASKKPARPKETTEPPAREATGRAKGVQPPERGGARLRKPEPPERGRPEGPEELQPSEDSVEKPALKAPQKGTGKKRAPKPSDKAPKGGEQKSPEEEGDKTREKDAEKPRR